MPSFCFAPLMLRRSSSQTLSKTSTRISTSSESSDRPSTSDSLTNCNPSLARSAVGIELRSWDPSNIPRTRYICGDTSWMRLHEVAFTTFERDPKRYTVHFHMDPLGNPTSANKPLVAQRFWTTGMYHAYALRIRGDRKFVIYAHFVSKE